MDARSEDGIYVTATTATGTVAAGFCAAGISDATAIITGVGDEHHH